MTASEHEAQRRAEAEVPLSVSRQPPQVPRSSGLLEREEELERIASAIASVSPGVGGVMALEGSPGIGKTRLLQRATELAADNGVAVVSARGGHMETEFPFGVARQLFEAPFINADPSEREEMLDGPAAPAAWLLRGGSTDPPGERATGGDRGFATLHGLYWLTAKLAAGGPLLIVVDDVHWADAPSLRFLVYLARRLHRLRVLLLVAVRSEVPGAHGLLVSELVTGLGVEVIRPKPLTLEAVRTLVHDAFPRDPMDPNFVRGFWTATGGNPFLATQLIGVVRARGLPPKSEAIEQIGQGDLATVARWINLRLAALPPSATALVQAVAVLGDSADATHAGRLAGLDVAACDESVDALVTMSVLRLANGVSFTHPLVRSAIYAELPPRWRARAHRDAARLLWQAGATAERVASHLLVATPMGDGDVVEILLAAARSASRAGAPDIAVRYLKRALAEPPPDELVPKLVRELGAAEQDAGHFSAAAADLRRALECTEDISAKLEIAFRLRYALVWSDRAAEVAPALEDVIAEVAQRAPDAAQLLEAAVAGIPLVDLSRPASERARLRKIVEPALLGESVPSHVSSLAAVDALYANQPATEVLGLAEQALRGWHHMPGFARHPLTAQLFVALIFAENFVVSRRLLDEEIEDARRQGSAAQFLNAAAFRSMLLHRLGALAEAEADARAALEAAHLHRPGGGSEEDASTPSLHAPMAVAVLVETLIERGNLENAEAVLAQSGLGHGDSPLMLFTFLIRARARLAVALGRPAEAITELFALGRRIEGSLVTPSLVPWRSQVALSLVGEDDDEARQLAGEELALARAFGAPRTLGVALCAAALTGARSDRVGLLSEAAMVLETSPARLEHARALVELGAALRRQGQRSEAQGPLERGMDSAQGCGATALAERARAELRMTGARPRRLALTGVDALTAAERRVADLAIQGLTNREIARALVVSLSTVETHLRHVYRKLDVSSRTQLLEHLRGQDSTDL